MMTKDQQIEVLTNTLTSNYDMPEEFAKGLAEFLYDEGYLLEQQSVWIYDEDLDEIVCCACDEPHPKNTSDNFCPGCGARMKELDFREQVRQAIIEECDRKNKL